MPNPPRPVGPGNEAHASRTSGVRTIQPALADRAARYLLLFRRGHVMVDAAIEVAGSSRRSDSRSSLKRTFQRKSTIAFMMTLPLILLIAALVIYPAFYAVHLAMLNKSMERFVGLSNFTFLFKRETFWMVVWQSCIFAITAVFFKALFGFFLAHFVHNVPVKKQRKWRGMLLIPWVIPTAMSTLAWLWLFDPSYSAFNWILAHFNIGPVPWTGEANWARFCVILVNIWIGAPCRPCHPDC